MVYLPPDVVYKIVGTIPIRDTAACAASALICRNANETWKHRVLENLPQFQIYSEDPDRSIILDADALGTYFMLKAILVYKVKPETIFELTTRRVDLSSTINIYITFNFEHIEGLDAAFGNNEHHVYTIALQRTSMLSKFRECLMRQQTVCDENTWADIKIVLREHAHAGWGSVCTNEDGSYC